MSSSPDRDATFQSVDPYALARNEAEAGRLKRFYQTASVAPGEGGFVLKLDAREARTPARRAVLLPTLRSAALLAEEWNAQGEVIKPSEMPTVRLANSVIDGVASTMGPVRDEIVRFAGTDLLCYRADGPPELVERQAAAWDPVIDWAREELDARFYLAEGVMHVTQPEPTMEAIRRAVVEAVGQGAAAPFRLGAMHVITTLTGSALLALAVAKGSVSAESAWAKAHVDEDYQISQWGGDAEAALRRERRWHDLKAAAMLAAAVEADG